MDATKTAINWTTTAAAEASRLGLRPGNWPLYITVTGPQGEAGLGELFILDRKEMKKNADGELLHVVYATPRGDIVLTVYND